MTGTTAGGARDDGFLRRLTWWLEPRWRDPGWWAFALNRLTGHILILYLAAHMLVLAMLTQGEDGWNSLLGIFGSRPFLVGDVLLIAAILFHGLNGVRIMLLTAGIGTRRSSQLFGLVFAVSAGLAAIAGWMILFE
jgi:succinate dehydrogenase / fumarate reductase cytochrome b subunit